MLRDHCYYKRGYGDLHYNIFFEYEKHSNIKALKKVKIRT